MSLRQLKMVEPITISIISLCVMGFLAVNSAGLTLSYFVPWCLKESRKRDQYRKRISRTNAPTMLALVLMEYITWQKLPSGNVREGLIRRKNSSTRTLPFEIVYTNGTMLFNIPDIGFKFRYGDMFKMVTTADDSGGIIGVELYWEEEKHQVIQAFLARLEEKISKIEGTAQ